MDQETLYTAAKWEVLKALSKQKKSPIELAEISHTSVSNISQSLRFLELAGIVKSERISNRDKGQPRVLYSLSGNNAYLIVTSKNFVQKKQIILDTYKKMLLKVWFYENEMLHPFLEKAIQNLEPHYEELQGIYYDTKKLTELKLLIIFKDKPKDIKEFKAQWQGETMPVKYESVTKEAIKEHYYEIYAPQTNKEDDAKK